LTIYIDTSFLMSLYSPDVNSTTAAHILQAKQGELLVTVFGELELANALELRVFRKELSATQVRLAFKDFSKDLQDGIFRLRPLLELVFGRARELCRKTTARLGTRTSDLLHVAAALELGADWLYSFDQRQRKPGQTVGLNLN
jgi:predicted nucleic acid-binding protein